MNLVFHFFKQLHHFAGKILYFNLFGMMFASFLDGMGIFLLIPMLNILGIASMNNFPIHIPSAISHYFQNDHKETALLFILGFYILLNSGQALIYRNLSIRDIRIHTAFVNHVRLQIYSAILEANWEFFTKRRKSDLINALTDELARMMVGTKMFLQLLSSLVFTLIQVCIALWLSAKMTLFVLICGLFMTFFARRFIRSSRMLGNDTSELAQSYMAGITDQFQGIKDIKSNMLEESRFNWLNSWCQRISHERIAHFRLGSNSQLLYKISSAIIIALFIYLSISMFKTPGEELLLVIVIFSKLWPRFTGIQSNLEQIYACIPALKSLIDLQNECEKGREFQINKHSNIQPIELKHGIQCSDVSFRYNRNEDHYALKNINLSIPSNCMTAIVGRSGAGKSTLIDLLMGLLVPEKGQVIIDGTPLTSENLLSLRRSISYVPQDPFLFNGSIRENLLLVMPNASEAQLWEALEFASAEFVGNLPQGLDSRIGDRGIRLSGGERQRLVLARAILRSPAILVLDEATSALDTENEARIQSAIERLKGKMTIIVIAHRLSTIRNADKVIVLDEGIIVQSGGFNQLAKEKKGMFSKLLSKQFEVNNLLKLN